MSELKQLNPTIAKTGWSEPRPYGCGLCKDTGTMLARRKDLETGVYAFRCSCGRARTRGCRFPEWRGDSETFEAVRS